MSEIKISTMIEQLEQFKTLYGDLPVMVGTGLNYKTPAALFAYGKNTGPASVLLIYYHDPEKDQLKQMAETAKALIEKQGETEQ